MLKYTIEEIINLGSLSVYILNSDNGYEDALNISLEQVTPGAKNCLLERIKNPDSQYVSTCLDIFIKELKEKITEDFINTSLE